MRFKDLPVPDFQEDTLCPHDISVLESIDTSEKTTTSIAQEEQDAFVTAIISRQVTPDNVVEATPLQTIPTGIRSLFVNLIEDWVQKSILNGVKTIMGMIRNQDSARALLANKTQVSRSLKILHSMVENSQLSTVEISWLIAQIEETFNAAEIVAKIEEMVDTERLNLLSSRDSTYSSKIAQLESKLKELCTKALNLELTEKEILREEECIRQMRKDFLNAKQKLAIAEGNLRVSLDLKKKGKEQLQKDLANAGFAKLHDLEKEKGQLENLIDSIVSFNKY